MKKPSSFYVVYPANQNLRDLLNALKLIADENQRTEAHVTVRGPYVMKLKKEHVEKFAKVIRGEVLKVSKVDNFFAFNQNTVFFSCEENESLKSIWRKMTYNEFRPHITIYDGDDREFAVKLFQILASDFKPFDYKISDLTWLEPKADYELKLNYLKSIPDYNSVLERILNISKQDIDFSKLHPTTRLSKISKIARILYNEEF